MLWMLDKKICMDNFNDTPYYDKKKKLIQWQTINRKGETIYKKF